MAREKAVVILSGGLDSTVLAYYANRYYDLYILSFDYGQRHKKELLFAEATAKRLNAKAFHRVNLNSITELLEGSALTSPDVSVPDGHYSAANMAVTVVPNRNAIMLSIAYGYAVSIGAKNVFAGVHAGDHEIYPDCRPDFIEVLDLALRLGNEGFRDSGLRIQTPFVNETKAYVVETGANLGVPFDQTWSCYKGGEKHCGKCGTCVERQEAFHLAHVPDPTEYEDPDYWKTATAQ